MCKLDRDSFGNVKVKKYFLINLISSLKELV
jgi:hypothetical protein